MSFVFRIRICCEGICHQLRLQARQLQSCQTLSSLSPNSTQKASHVVDPSNAAKATQLAEPVQTSNREVLWIASIDTPENRSMSSYDDLSSLSLAYQVFNVIYITMNDLQKLASENQPQWIAIQEWIARGGQLIVFNDDHVARDSFEQVDRLLITVKQDANNTSTKKAAESAWKELVITSDLVEIQVKTELRGFAGVDLGEMFRNQQLGVRRHELGEIVLLGATPKKKAIFCRL